MICIKEWVSVNFPILQEIVSIINQYALSKNFKKIMKGEDDPVTQADFKIQTLIKTANKKFYPQLSIVGQQQSEFKGQITFDYSKLNTNMFQNLNINTNYNVNDCCLWVDPIDGRLDGISTLIGLTFKNRPAAGIIVKYYTKISQDNYKLDPIIYFTQLNYPKFIVLNTMEEIEPKINSKDKDFIIAVSSTRCTQKQMEFIKELNFQQIKKQGGAGIKGLKVALGQDDIMLYLNGLTSKWDISALELFVLKMGGKITDLNGQIFIYDKNSNNYLNTKGVICCGNQKIFNYLIQKTKQYCKIYL